MIWGGSGWFIMIERCRMISKHISEELQSAFNDLLNHSNPGSDRMQNNCQEERKKLRGPGFYLCSSQIPVCSESCLITRWDSDPMTTWVMRQRENEAVSAAHLNCSWHFPYAPQRSAGTSLPTAKGISARLVSSALNVIWNIGSRERFWGKGRFH